MKTINNTCKEVLPSLLDKTKTQTIRPAWKDGKNYYNSETGKKLDKPKKFKWYKPSKYEVGERCVLVWNGNMDFYHKLTKCKVVHKLGYPIRLGEVEITEVFEIEMAKDFFRIIHKNDLPPTGIHIQDPYYKEFINNLTKRDGFKSVEDMLKYFDKEYGISEPLNFYVYRWRWL